MVIFVTLALLATLAVTVYAIHRCLTHRSIRHLRGPSSGFVFGNILEMFYQDQVGDLDFKWLAEYGTAWRVRGCLGEDVLMVTDPKALQHIFHKSGYHYPKKKDVLAVVRLITGRGIVWASGADHRRHRKIMNPAFTAVQLRSFLPLFTRSASKMCDKLTTELFTMKSVEPIKFNTWLSRTTLDIIGEAAFDYDFGALDNGDNEVSKAYHNMFADSVLYPTKWNILFRSFWRYIPTKILNFVEYMPTREYTRFRQTMKVVNRVSKQLIEKKTKAYLSGEPNVSKDVMSILVKANLSEDPKMRLKDEEMTAQMATLILAGHDTTAATLTWLFWEVAKNPEYQNKMRAEVIAFKKAVLSRGDTEFTINDLNSMEYILAAIKETLRLHPIIYQLQRCAERDDVIPLAYPIVSNTGEQLNSIPVRAGQNITVSMCAYQRLTDVWGQDANKWNPMRFINLNSDKQTKIGMYANLMTFSAGIRGCIGWQFSVIEMQALVVQLVERFQFALPPDKPEIQRVPAGLMGPMVRGKMHEGMQMPLCVSVVE